MKKSRTRYLVFGANLFILILLFSLRYSGLLTLSIGQAVPITLLPFVISVSLFFGEWYGAVAGFGAGALMDSVVTGSSSFNTITLMLIGLTCGIFSSYYVNKNLRSAACLSLGGSFVYLVAKTIFFYSSNQISIGLDYYSRYFIPTVFYTALFIIPFYFIEKKLRKL